MNIGTSVRVPGAPLSPRVWVSSSVPTSALLFSILAFFVIGWMVKKDIIHVSDPS